MDFGHSLHKHMKLFFSTHKKESEVIECEDCRHLIKKSVAQAIPLSDYGDDYTLYYCPEHRKPYDRIFKSYNNDGSMYTYYKAREPWEVVDKNGKTIK